MSLDFSAMRTLRRVLPFQLLRDRVWYLRLTRKLEIDGYEFGAGQTISGMLNIFFLAYLFAPRAQRPSAVSTSVLFLLSCRKMAVENSLRSLTFID